MLRCIVFVLFFYFSPHTLAWTWKDLWATPDQQAARYFENQDYTNAEKTFKQKEWQATSAYRAKNFEQANSIFAQSNTADGYYNEGNAKAQLGKYEEAIAAYEKSLKLRPHDEDTLHNKKILEALLKQQQSETDASQDNANHSEKENSDASPSQNNKTPPSQQEESNSTQSPTSEQTPSNKLEDDLPQNQSQPTESSHPKDPQKEEEKKEEKSQSKQTARENPSAAENYQTSEQWLNMIPEDPRGLLRQKFLRDHRRRLEGESP